MSHQDARKNPADHPHEQSLDHEAVPAADDQPAEPESFQWRSWLWGFVQRMFIMLSLYVLSIGPMYWHWYGGRFAEGSKLIAAFYEPLYIMALAFPRFGEWMDWYVSLWVG